MIIESEVPKILIQELNIKTSDLDKLYKFKMELLSYNKRYNLISKSTENVIWSRHILDSAQLVKFIDFNSDKNLIDLGSGGGFPGLILAIFNSNPKFHVKLYEKSNVKLDFLNKMVDLLDIECSVAKNINDDQIINCDYLTSRAFKKLPEILNISREKIKISHKIIILKGKSAQEEINKASKNESLKYKLFDSMTDKESKIIIVDAIKSE